MGIESLARPEIVAMKPYSSARKEAPGNGILLNANEAPWPVLDGSGLNRYPDPQPAVLLARLAALYGVPEQNVLVTRGSDEGIDLLTRVFCRAGRDAVLHCPPTFGMYRIAAQTQGADVVSVPRDRERLLIDEPALLDRLQADERIRLVFLTSPNNPTGDVISADFLESLLLAARNRAVVVVDEAYAEFCREPSATRLISGHENLVVLRTLSKAWGAAGLRCGAVLAQADIISLLRRIIAPYPLPSPVVDLALRVLGAGGFEQKERLVAELAKNKDILLERLEGRAFIRELFPGRAKFVLARVDDADGLLTFCARQGVIIRGFPADPSLQGCIRISVGTADEIDTLTAALDEWESTR